MEIKTTTEIARIRASGEIHIPDKKWVAVDDVLKFLNDENYGRQDMIDIISEESTIKSQKLKGGIK